MKRRKEEKKRLAQSDNDRKEEKKTLGIQLNMEVCPILGVDILVTDREKTVAFIEENIRKLSGEYICVSNVHTTVMAYEDKEYRRIQLEAAAALPDGRPLSMISKRKGFKEAGRVTGPDLMERLFARGNAGNGLKHFFYGGSQETLNCLQDRLIKAYPKLQIVGMYSPPFRPLTKEEDREVVERINQSQADLVWIGLGAPKQERWMYAHRGKICGLMLGVGAGFDYHAGKLKRAPQWMQQLGLEWFVRFLQDPKRLWKRYLVTNTKFIWYLWKEKQKEKDYLGD